jgi:hypothetical protein
MGFEIGRAQLEEVAVSYARKGATIGQLRRTGSRKVGADNRDPTFNVGPEDAVRVVMATSHDPFQFCDVRM